MPNALMPDTSSYADPIGNALLAKGWDGNQALQQVQSTQQIQRNQVALSSEQIALGRQKMQALNSVLGAIGDDPTLDNAHARIIDAVRNGAWTPDMGESAMNELSATDGSPGAIKRLALQHQMQNASIDQQLQAMGAGAPQLVDTGSQKVPMVVQSGLNPSISPAGGAPIANTLTPAEKTGQVNFIDPTTHAGQSVSVGQRFNDDGTLRGTPPASGGGTFAEIAAGRPPSPAGGAGSVGAPPPPASAPTSGQGAGQPPAAPSGQAPTGTWTPTINTMPVVTKAQADAATARVQAKQGTPADRNLMRAYLIQNSGTQAQPTTAKGLTFEPQPGQPPQAAGQGGAPAAPAPAGGAIPPGRQPPAPVQAPGAGGPPGGTVLTTSLAPGVGQAATVDADASAKQFAGITAAATNLPTMKATVANMEAVLPQITTGPQAAAWNHVKSAVNFGTELTTGKDAFDPHAIAAQDEFHNNSVKLAQQQFQQLGGTGTDGQLASASGDVPNESLSNMSNSQLLAMNKGLIDAQQARASAAEAWKQKNGPTSYSSFVDSWNKSFSPRAFQFNYLTPAERGTMLHSMSPQEKAQLKTAYDTAVQNQWIAPQGGR